MTSNEYKNITLNLDLVCDIINLLNKDSIEIAMEILCTVFSVDIVDTIIHSIIERRYRVDDNLITIHY